MMLQTETVPNKLELNVQDISVGGVALISYAKEITFESGAIYRDCSIDLPGMGTIACDIEIKDVFVITMRNGKKHKRSCCEFLNISQEQAAMIQRYIHNVERDRIAKSI